MKSNTLVKLNFFKLLHCNIDNGFELPQSLRFEPKKETQFLFDMTVSNYLDKIYNKNQ